MAFETTNNILHSGEGPEGSVWLPNITHTPSATTLASGLAVANSSLPLPRDWTGGLIAEYVIRFILGGLTVLVNMLVLVTIATSPKLRCATNCVIGSLAVTDLFVGLVTPGGLLIELQVLVSPLLCRVGYAGVMALGSVSINHLLFVSVDRYLLISKPLRYRSIVTKRRVCFFICVCWTWAAAISLPFALGLTVNPDWDGRCLAELMIPLWFVICLSLMHFLLPLVVMMYVHIAIFVVARRQQKAVTSSFKANSNENEGNRGLSSSKAKLRAARLLVLPCGYFYVSWGPFFITILWAVGSGRMVEPHELERFVQTLAILNSLGNPILYAVSQPVLGRAMLSKLSAFSKAFQRCCCPTAYIKQRVETTSLVTPDQSETTPV